MPVYRDAASSANSGTQRIAHPPHTILDTSDGAKAQRLLVTQGVQVVVVYSLSLAVGLAVNGVITSVLKTFPTADNILNKATYALILLGAAVAATYFLNRQMLEMSGNYDVADISKGHAWPVLPT